MLLVSKVEFQSFVNELCLDGGAINLLKASVFQSLKPTERQLPYLLQNEYEIEICRKIKQWGTNICDLFSREKLYIFELKMQFFLRLCEGLNGHLFPEFLRTFKRDTIGADKEAGHGAV